MDVMEWPTHGPRDAIHIAGRPAPTGEDNSALRGFRALQLEFGIQLTGEGMQLTGEGS